MARILYSHVSYEETKRTIARRLLFILCIYVVVLLALKFDADGLRDSTKAPGEPLTWLDLVYFTAITMTTTGYGDIVPVSPMARAIDLVLVTPSRILVWLIFWGTAVEITARRFREEYEMKHLKDSLADHSIICGFGVTGRSAAAELVKLGVPPDKIVVIDLDERCVREAAEYGYTALCGDATRENILSMAAVEKARQLIVATSRDDTNILVCLTAKNMNSGLKTAARVNEEENTKLMRSGGADVTVLPALAGGRLLASAASSEAVVGTLEDLLTCEGGMRILEKRIGRDEAGVPLVEFPHGVVISLQRKEERVPFSSLKEQVLQEGDVVVYIRDTASPSESSE